MYPTVPGFGRSNALGPGPSYRGHMKVIVYEDLHSIAVAAADHIERVNLASDHLALGLAGGSTPRLVHRELAGRQIDWERVTTWITDERWLAADDDEANQQMARQTLVADSGVRFLAPDTALDSPSESAETFTATLLEAGIPHAPRSIIMLGMGPDGHTASLFPGTKALTETGERYVANRVPRMDTWRLTATFDLIATADTVLFLVAGADKAEMLREIKNGTDVPAANVHCHGEVLWMVDEAAAERL